MRLLFRTNHVRSDLNLSIKFLLWLLDSKTEIILYVFTFGIRNQPEKITGPTSIAAGVLDLPLTSFQDRQLRFLSPPISALSCPIRVSNHNERFFSSSTSSASNSLSVSARNSKSPDFAFPLPEMRIFCSLWRCDNHFRGRITNV